VAGDLSGEKTAAQHRCAWIYNDNVKLLIVNFEPMLPVNQWLKKLQFCLFPPTCLLCGAPGEDGRDLCAGCHADLPCNEHACQRCGMPLASAAVLNCGECQLHPPPYDRTFAPLLYQPPVDYLIKGLKFGGRLAIARLLGEWLGAALQQREIELPEGIIPAPLHPSRLRERGFNQSLELARPVARCLGVPLLLSTVRRTRHTQPQAQLDAAARRSNVQGAFSVTRPVQVRHVAILDDVITTGSTVTEIAKVLKAAGVEEIEVWAVARTAQ